MIVVVAQIHYFREEAVVLLRAHRELLLTYEAVLILEH